MRKSGFMGTDINLGQIIVLNHESQSPNSGKAGFDVPEAVGDAAPFNVLLPDQRDDLPQVDVCPLGTRLAHLREELRVRGVRVGDDRGGWPLQGYLTHKKPPPEGPYSSPMPRHL